MSLILRDYQEEAVKSFFDFVTYQGGRKGVISAPTGSGQITYHKRHLQDHDHQMAAYKGRNCNTPKRAYRAE